MNQIRNAGEHLLTRGRSRCFPYFFFPMFGQNLGYQWTHKSCLFDLNPYIFWGWIILTPPVRMISQHQVVCVLRSLPFPMGSSACRLPKNSGCCCDEVCLPGAHHESPLMLIMLIGPPGKTACTKAAVTERLRSVCGKNVDKAQAYSRAWRCLPSGNLT